jgi:thioredoxin 1
MESDFRHFLNVLVAMVFLAGCAGKIPSPAPELSRGVVMLDKTNFAALVAVPGRVSMVEFYHPGCPPCMKMDGIVGNLGARFGGRALIGKVNVDTDDSLKSAFPVIPTPTFLFFNGGTLTGSSRGVFKEDSLAAVIDSLLAGSSHE